MPITSFCRSATAWRAAGRSWRQEHDGGSHHRWPDRASRRPPPPGRRPRPDERAERPALAPPRASAGRRPRGARALKELLGRRRRRGGDAPDPPRARRSPRRRHRLDRRRLPVGRRRPDRARRRHPAGRHDAALAAHSGHGHGDGRTDIDATSRAARHRALPGAGTAVHAAVAAITTALAKSIRPHMDDGWTQ
ncbi:hypothetical protein CAUPRSCDRAFT_12029 [Caulochytrium protostelioides]|uniref:Uncharacterized protein n=1 Tax=Caulochytrium protostelioides TaxID=1555241 RepID=A0A4P9WSS3_9FUNG|nr:hypothetical protein CAUPRSCDRAFT_12029 [Caulochytrium protostelioides]